MSQLHHAVASTPNVQDQDNPSHPCSVDVCQRANSIDHPTVLIEPRAHSETILPPELLALIISFLAYNHRNADLVSLLTVSRQIHTLAEAELLRDVSLSIECLQDDSRSPLIQFHRCIKAPNDYRQRLVRSLYVHFFAGGPWAGEVRALGELIPALTNLRSLGLKLTWWSPSAHGSLGWLEEGMGMGEVALRKLEIAVQDVGADEVCLDITGLLRAQPSICDLTLSGRIRVGDNGISLPRLRAFRCFLYNPLRSLVLGAAVVMSTFVVRTTKVKGISSVVMLTTMKSQENDPVCFNVFLAMVSSLGGLAAYMKKNNTGKAMEVLSPLCHAKEREEWFPTHITWISHHTELSSSPASDDESAFTASSVSRPSLQWIERVLQACLGGGAGASELDVLRWYGGRGGGDSVVVKLEAMGYVYEVWRADWESNVRSFCIL